MDRNLLLHLHGAAHRSVDAIEHDEQGVAASLDDPAAMLLMAGSIRLLRRCAAALASRIIQPDQAAVTHHIGIDDGNEFPPPW